MENLRPEELLTEETVEAGTAVVEQVVEEVAKNGGASLLKKCGIVGGVVALVAGGYAGYKFLKKKKSEKAAEESEEGVVADTECKETSEEVEKDSEK